MPVATETRSVATQDPYVVTQTTSIATRVTPAELPLEVDLPPRVTVELGALRLADGVLRRGDTVLLERVYAAPVVADDRVYVAADNAENGAIYLVDPASGEPRTVVTGGRPDRLAVGPDGALAFVSGVTGLASVWVRTPDGVTRQLTNVGVSPTPGARPPGFVAPPRSPPAFDGDWLRWDGGGVRWR